MGFEDRLALVLCGGCGLLLVLLLASVHGYLVYPLALTLASTASAALAALASQRRHRGSLALYLASTLLCLLALALLLV